MFDCPASTRTRASFPPHPATSAAHATPATITYVECAMNRRRITRFAPALAIIALTATVTSGAGALRLPAARTCPIFPATNPWNQRVDTLPVAANSAQLVASIGLDSPVHPDFGSG